MTCPVTGRRVPGQRADLGKKAGLSLFPVCVQENALLPMDVLFFPVLCTKVFLVRGHLTQNINFRARLEEFKIGELTKLNKNE